MGTSVLLLFPIGAVFMRAVGSPLLHGIVQVLALGVLLAGFAVGVRMAHILDIVSSPDMLPPCISMHFCPLNDG